MKHVLALRHVYFESLGTFEPLLAARGYAVRHVDAVTDDLAAIDALAPDVVVVLGGPIGAFDEALFPFLRQELRIIEARLAAGRPLLGVCLGAQLIARALGAAVAPMGHKEIGFAAVDLTSEGATSPLAALAGVPVLHWHGDRFDLPGGATRLATSPLCDQQAFSYRDATLALQFHAEVDAAQIDAWLVGHIAELSAAGIDVRGLRDDAHAHGPRIASAGARLLSAWLDGLPGPHPRG